MLNHFSYFFSVGGHHICIEWPQDPFTVLMIEKLHKVYKCQETDFTFTLDLAPPFICEGTWCSKTPIIGKSRRHFCRPFSQLKQQARSSFHGVFPWSPMCMVSQFTNQNDQVASLLTGIVIGNYGLHFKLSSQCKHGEALTFERRLKYGLIKENREQDAVLNTRLHGDNNLLIGKDIILPK